MKKLKLSDEQLVVKVRDQDQELYGEIVRRYQAKLIRYATYIISDEDIAKDVVQNSFIKAFINLRGFDENKKFSSWIYRIVHNEAINNLKKRRWEVSLDISEWVGIGTGSKDEVLENLERREISTMVKKSLDKLSLQYRSVLVLYYLEEKSYEEIAEVLRVPIGTVGTRISRGKKKLAKIVLDNEGEYEKPKK